MARLRSAAVPLIVAGLAVAWVAAGIGRPQLRADSPGYYANLRSPVFDGDFDLRNEWEHWGLRSMPGDTGGRKVNPYTLGPALLWAPFFLLAHAGLLIARAVGLSTVPADGYSVPYLRAVYLGTLVVALLGGDLLARMMAARVGRTWALLAVMTAVAASPILYYVLIVPAMTHGLVFGLVAALIWAGDRVQRAPTRRAWWLMGALTGLAPLVRHQTAVVSVLFLILAAKAYRAGSAARRWVVEAALIGIVITVPQLILWKTFYGSWLVLPQGSGFFVAGFPWVWDVFFNAERGFFIWTPLMAVATVGLAAGWRQWGVFAPAGLAVLALTGLVNGSTVDWHGSDSFGSRRFDVVVPFLALGLATVLQWQARRPAVLASVVCGAAVLWNVGMIGLYRDQWITDVAPLERVAGYQGRRLRHSLEDLASRLGGPRLKALVYKGMVGEYFYWNLNLDGTIDLSTPEERYLAGGWSEPRWEGNRPKFRWAFPPKACLRFPIGEPTDLRTVIRARSPSPATQIVSVALNDVPVSSLQLSEEWTDLHLVLPARAMVPGENLVCLGFASSAPIDDGREAGAAVAHIQLP